MIRIFFNSPIFITFVVHTFYVAKYRTVKKYSYHRCSLVPVLFTPPLPSNPIYHQLSQRECFLYLVPFIFFTLGCLNITRYQYDIVYLPSSTGKCIHQNLYLYVHLCNSEM